MKNFLFAFLICVATPAFVEGNNADVFSFLVPQNMGTLGKLGQDIAQTEVVNIAYSLEGVVHRGWYTDGGIGTILTAENDKKVGHQYVLIHGSEVSRSKEFYIDPDQPDVVVHVHKKFLVYTGKDKQQVIPRVKK